MNNLKQYLLVLFILTVYNSNAQGRLDFSKPPVTPELFGKGLISSGLSERDFAISPDGTEIFYTLQSPQGVFQTILQMKKQVNGSWSKPVVAPFAGKYSDLEPAFTADGKKLFFASNRPVSGTEIKDFDIWVVEKENGNWGEPKNIGAPVNTAADEFYPSITKTGNLYFTAAYKNGIGKEDIFMAKWENGKYGEPAFLDTAINSKMYEFNAFVSPDEDFIIFTSYGRKDDKGRGDLYMSRKDAAGKWQPAWNLTLLNSEKLDYCPFISPDKKVLFFTSERNSLKRSFPGIPVKMDDLVKSFTSPLNGGGDIYWVSFDALMLQGYLKQAPATGIQLKSNNYADTTQVDMQKLAKNIAGNTSATYEKVRSVIAWTNENFEWTYTDYKKRTVKEIICRRGGNCAEQAMVVWALLKELSIKTRRISEINIQPEKEERQKDSEKLFAEYGNRASVFGYRHNDHVWTEFFDEEKKKWVPADPTLGLIGLENWLKARIGFEPRVNHAILPSADMLVPIAVFALNPDGTIAENRSEYYLIKSFNRVYKDQLEKLQAWKQWEKSVQYIQAKSRNAFEGKENLHNYTERIRQLKETYELLKKQYLIYESQK